MYRIITRKETKKDRLVGLKMDRRRMKSSKTKEVGRMDNGYTKRRGLVCGRTDRNKSKNGVG